MSADSIGVRVASLRTMCGCSTQSLADAAGVSRSIVGFLENGNRLDPRTSTLAAIAAACGVTLDWLVNGAGPEPQPDTVKTAFERAKAQREAA